MAKSPFAKAGDIKDAGVIPGLGRPPGKGMTTHSIILAWRIPWTEEHGGYCPYGCRDTLSTDRPSLVTTTLKLFVLFSGFL